MDTWKELTSAAKTRKQNEEQKKKQRTDTWNDLRKEAISREVDDKYINSFITDSNSFLTQSQTDWDNLSWASATNSESAKKRAQQADDLRNRQGKVRAWLTLNKDSIDEDIYNQFTSYLNGVDYGGVVNQFKKASDVYSQYESQEHYDVYNMPLLDLKAKVDAGGGIAYTTKDGNEITWEELYDSADVNLRYDQYSKNADWAEKSQGITDTFDMQSDYQIIQRLKTEPSWPEPYEGWTDEQRATYEEQKQKDAEQRETEMAYISEKYGVDFSQDATALQEELNRLGNRISSGYGEMDTFRYMHVLSEKELAVLNYIYNVYGREEALRWHKSRYGLGLEEKNRLDRNLRMQKIGDTNPIFGSAISLGTNLAAGFEGLYNTAKWIAEGDMTWNKAEAIAGGFGDWVLSSMPIASEIAKYNDFSFTNGVDWESLPEMERNEMADITNSLRGGVMAKRNADVLGYDVHDLLYGTTMSGLDSAIANAAFGPTGGAIVMGGSAAGQASNDALDRGLSGGQAFNTGVAAGVNEAFWEYFSAGKLDAFQEAPVNSWGDLGRNLGKLAGTNALEEAATEKGNLAYDRIANGDKSNYELAIQAYMAKGYTEEEARRKAELDDWGQVAEAGVSGALMGVGFGASGTVSNARQLRRADKAAAKEIQNRANRTINTDGGTDALLTSADDLAGVYSGKNQARIEKAIAKVRSDPTVKNVSNLYKAIGKATNSQSVADIVESLESKGVSRTIAKRIANSVVSLSKNNAIRKSDVNLLADDLVNAAYGDEQDSNAERRIESGTVQDAVRSILNDIVLNEKSAMGQRNQKISDLQKNIVYREINKAVAVELVQEGVEQKTAEKIADVIATAQRGEQLSAEANEVLQAVQENPKLAKAIRSAIEAINMSAEDAFRNLGKRYSGGNQVIASMPKLQQDTFAKIYDSKVNGTAVQFADAMAAAYALGYNNQKIDLEGVDGALLSTLTEAQRQFAWKEGRSVAASDAESAQKTIDSVYKKAEKALKKSGSNAEVTGKVTTKGISVNKMNPEQKASYDLAQQIAPAVKADIVVYKGGKEWGFYDHKTDSIHLNANANWNNHNMMVFVLAHELVHRAKKGSPMQFKAFSDFLLEQYGKQGADIDAMIGQQMAAADRFDQTAAEADKIRMTPEMALEEVICDAAQRMLLDTDAGKKLAQWGAQSQQNKGFLEKVKSIIRDILNLLRSALKGVDPDSLAAQEFGKMEANAKKILADMFVDMSIDAGEKLSTIKAAADAGHDFAKQYLATKNVQYNLAATESHKAKLQEKYSDESTVSLETLMNRYDKILSIWKKLGGELDSKFRARLKDEAKKHRKDQKIWEAEFERLLKAYDAAGRNIQKLEETVAHQRQAARDKVEGRRKTEMRHKIIRFKEKLQNTLQRPTDNSYIPVDLISAMVDVCELIDDNAKPYKKNGSINKAQAERDATRDRLLALKDEYSKLRTNSDPIYQGEFDEMIETYLDELRQEFTGKSLKDMTLDELQTMYEILRSIDETLLDARKLIDFGEKVDAYEAGDSIIDEQRGITQSRKNGRRNKAARLRDTSLNYTLSPMRNVERMSGYHGDSFLLLLFKKFEQGIRKKNKFMMDAYQLFEKLTSAKAYDQAMYTEVGGKKYVDVNGRKFGISKMQMMQAVLSFERELVNGHNHIQKGGFTFADLDKLKKGKLGEAITEEYAHRIPAATGLINEFMEILQGDDWCQQYMAAARSFFNGMAKDAINETSIAWKHRAVAQEKNYIPYEVDKNFVMNEISAANNIQETINAYGMLKTTQDKAPQPLIITGLNNILDRHIEKVGSVYGLAIPVRNFNKVWNMRSNSVEGNPTVKSVIELNWGKEGIRHIEQAVQDIQGPRKNNQSELYRKVKSNYIGATFLLNLSVVTKQIGSLFSATSMLRWRDPVRMIGNLFYTMGAHKKIAAEVNKYTASAWMRRQGVSDAELHTLMTEAKKGWIGKVMSKLPAPLSPGKWIAAMDYTVSLSLWRYAKIDTAKRTGLKGEELLQATAEFYDEIIENTQSMTDVLHRPEVQKRGDILSDVFGMFKTDLYQMAGQLKVTQGRFAANKTGENARALGRTIYSVAMSAVWGQLMTTLFALLRYKVNPYRDEEDEDLTVESWLKRQGFAFAGDLLGYVFPLLGSEFVGFIENIVYGENEDFADSIALTAINDLYDTMVTFGSSIKEGEWPSMTDWRKFGARVLQLMGVPANNILRTWDAMKLHIEDFKNGELGSFEAGVDRTAANHAHRISEAVDAGNMNTAIALYEEAIEDLAGPDATDEERKEAETQIKAAIGEKYKDGQITKEIAEKFLREIVGESEDDIYWVFDRWDYAIAHNDSQEGYTKYDDFYAAVETGKDLKKTIKVYTDNGVSQKTLKKQITSYFKPIYLQLSKSEKMKMRGYLINAFVACGDTREQAMKKIDNWE